MTLVIFLAWLIRFIAEVGDDFDSIQRDFRAVFGVPKVRYFFGGRAGIDGVINKVAALAESFVKVTRMPHTIPIAMQTP